MKPTSIPNIDLGGKVQIIDDTHTPPRWKTLAHCFATEKHAKAICREHGLSGVWLVDDLGDRRYISA